MSENLSPSGQLDQASGVTETKSVSYDSFQKAVGEKKSFQAKYEEMRAKLESFENAQLQEQGKYKEALAKMQDEQRRKDAEFAQRIKAISTKVTKNQVASFASKLGAVNTDDVYTLLNIDQFELDDDFTIKEDDLQRALSEMQKNRPYLFKKEATSPRDLNQSLMAQGSNQKSMPKTSEEIIAALKALEAQN